MDSSGIRGQGSFNMQNQKILHVFTASSPKKNKLLEFQFSLELLSKKENRETIY